MKTALLMFHDDRRKQFAQLTVAPAEAYAKAAGIQFILHTAPFYEEPFMQKLVFIRSELPGVDRLVYADIDVLFNPGESVADLFTGQVNVSVDSAGFCAGFMAFENTAQVQRLLRIWLDLGMCEYQHDQGAFKALYANWGWIKALTREIPTSLVSNPESKKSGRIAHHGWAGDGQTGRLTKFSI